MQKAVAKHTWSNTAKLDLIHGKANVQASTLFMPFHVLENAQMLEETKASAIEAKMKRKEDARVKAEAKKLAQTCAVADCNMILSWPEGTKLWRCCANCGTHFCKDHVNAFHDHVEECNVSTEVDNPNVSEDV